MASGETSRGANGSRGSGIGAFARVCCCIFLIVLPLFKKAHPYWCVEMGLTGGKNRYRQSTDVNDVNDDAPLRHQHGHSSSDVAGELFLVGAAVPCAVHNDMGKRIHGNASLNE
jgi:hypothetical protein